MKSLSRSVLRSLRWVLLATLFPLVGPIERATADPATLLFQDDFTGGIPGWTSVMPLATYVDGPLLWQFDKVSNSFSEQSNIYTENATAPPLRRAVMLISDTVSPTNFVYTARLTSGDNDAFGLIWGFENDTTFYRLEFSQQAGRVAWPNTGWAVDRMSNAVPSDIAVNTVAFTLTIGRPFDVKIIVTNGLLTLTVDDDPLVSPVHYDLLVAQPLPSAPIGKVGIFSWGQAGGTPRSFRVQNPVLNGTPLDTAAISQVLSNWSFTVTPSTTNDYPVLAGLWSQALGANGDRGLMVENDDQAPENTTFSSTNTPVRAAVAGDMTWSNYVYSARLLTSDDDGFGLLLRYQNRTNWYRIAFRSQNSQAGIKRGISVQKNVNRTFDQMLSSIAFLPPTNSAFDVHAAIRDNTLQIMCVVNPDSTSPTITSFGPIDMGASSIVPANLTSGKIGVFSWAEYNVAPTPDNYGTGVDWVRVRRVNGEGLLVSSAYGAPDPPVGLNDLPVSGSITARVDNVVTNAPGIRQVSTGWAGGGSVPASGTTNEIVFTLAQFSLLNWKWQTQFLLAINATAGGNAVASLGPWVNPGSNVTITASANVGYVFTGWSGDSLSTQPALTIQMIRPITLTAHFAVDSDGDGLPDSWEIQYFGNLSQTAIGDPDADGKNNLLEYQFGTNPAFAEALVLADGLSSRWINEVRDRALPGWFAVTNFGGGFRGVWEASNQNRGANSAGPDDGAFINVTNYATNASFQGPLIVVRSNLWNPGWANTFSLSAEYSVGDNDGICLYFRYLDRSNWFRVTVCGDDTAAATRPLQSLSIQKRTNGWFSAIAPATTAGFIFNDELDTAIVSYKRLRITVNATNDTFEVRLTGWDVVNLNPPDWNTNSEQVVTFTDASLPTGRIAVGDWGMAGGKNGWNATTNNPNQPGVLVNPVGAGAFVDNVLLKVNGTNAFVEDWETAPVHTDLPAGWGNPYAGGPLGGLVGDWHVSAHGTIANFNFAFGSPQTGSPEFPKADGEGPILLAPPLTNANYVLELGIHPCDDGGMGFIYDFKDTNNFARVLFNSQVPLAGQFAQGLNVSRKSGGVWSKIVAGDPSFIYTPGRPFDVRFANNNGSYTLTVSPTDDPATVYHWTWTDQPAQQTNRVGLAIWDMPDAHYTYFRATSLPGLAPIVPFKIANISVSGGNVILDVSKPAGSSYHVLRATSAAGPYVTNAANQTAAQYTEPAPVGNTVFYRLQLVP